MVLYMVRGQEGVQVLLKLHVSGGRGGSGVVVEQQLAIGAAWGADACQGA